MPSNLATTVKSRIEKIRSLCSDQEGAAEWFEGATLALSVLHDTVGTSHPLIATIRGALDKSDYSRALASGRAVVSLFDQGALTSPRLAIAHEIEAEILDIAQKQVESAEANTDHGQKQLQLAIAAFLAGAALEDALRRICVSSGVTFDAQRTSIAKLQAALYQPSKQIEIINSSENKQITAWGDSRNKADHGQFSALTQAEVLSMVIGVRAFLDRHLP